MTQINKMFHTTLEERNIATNAKLDQLMNRISKLNRDFEEEKTNILRYIDERGAELTRMLNEFRVRTLPYTPPWFYDRDRMSSTKTGSSVWKEKRH